MSAKPWLVALGAAVAVCAALAWGAWSAAPRLRTVTAAPGARPAPPAGASDVVLVIACSLRADEAFPPGAAAQAVPNLSAWAARGTRVRDAVSPSPWTRPAVAGLLTGVIPRRLGLEEPADAPNWAALPPAADTLAERFAAAGWRTVGVSGSPQVTASFGFAQGFDQWLEVDPTGGVPAKAAGTALVAALAPALAQPGPVFAQLVLVDAHPPHEAPREEAKALRAWDGASDEVGRYRVAVGALDAAVGSIDALWQAAGRDPAAALVVVVNDHGEGLRSPEWHGRGHGRLLLPTSVGGVWLMRGPGVPAGHVMGGTTSLLDVAPTVLGLAGVSGLTDADGRDRSAAVRAGVASLPGETVWTETTYAAADRAASYTDAHLCQRDFAPPDAGEEHGRTGRGGRFVQGCCDRRRDPGCRRFVPDVAAEAALAAWRAEVTAAPAHAERATLTAEERAWIQSFGEDETRDGPGRRGDE